ncbi:MAG: translation initiation factor IF-2, partial [Pseudomonadota bacterium]
MRARGADVTDIVILVVAADDGVMPQTVEAVQHAKAAGVPIIVAVNKIDRENADPERVRSELAQHEVIPEDWGGDNMFVNVSAHTGEGVEALLEAIQLQAEVLDLKAPEEGAGRGVVVEASLEKGRGTVATVLVQGGTVRQGDAIVAGQEYGRVRTMEDAAQREVTEAGPSMPVVILGLSGAPAAGDDVVVVPDDKRAREVAEFRQSKSRDVKLAQQQAAKLEDVFSQMSAGESVSVQLLVKADVHGSAEALTDALTKLSGDEVRVQVVGSGVGGITETDINLAQASNAIIIGFNVRADAAARDAIKESGVDVRYYSIIYEAIDDVKAAVSGLLKPEIREQIVGLAEVREVFRSPKLGNIAGCMVADGYVRRANPIRVLRDNVVIYEGELESLRRFKDDVNEVRAGTECGIGVKNYNDVKVGDQIECYERVEVARTLD